MDAPSYWYAALDPNTRHLAAELTALGGGDAIAGTMELHCVVDDRLKEGELQMVWPMDKAIGLRDANMSLQASLVPLKSRLKTFEVSENFNIKKLLADSQNYTPIRSMIKNLLDGFNVCLIGYGEKYLRKTKFLFGDSRHYLRNLKYSECVGGFAKQFILSLYKELRSKPGLGTVALSVWVIKGTKIIDLLTPSTATSKGPLEFTLVDCPTADIALEVLGCARFRAPGAVANSKMESNCSEADRCHFFTRIVVHQQESTTTSSSFDSKRLCTGMLSHIHIVDLLGTAPVEGRQFNMASEDERIARRETQLQLLSFGKVLHEMVAICRSVDETSGNSHINSVNNTVGIKAGANVSGAALTSARDSVLTSILSPIIQGNCKTTVLCFIRDGDCHFSQTRASLSALDGVTRITCAAHKVTGVSLLSLPMIDYETAINTTYGQAVNAIKSGRKANSIKDNSDDNEESELSFDENIDLMRVAAGDYSRQPNKRNSNNAKYTHPPREDATVMRASIGDDAYYARESKATTIENAVEGRNDGSNSNGNRWPTSEAANGVLDTIMGEFHDLMAEMHSQTSIIKETVRKVEESSRASVDFTALTSSPASRRYLSALGPLSHEGNVHAPTTLMGYDSGTVDDSLEFEQRSQALNPAQARVGTHDSFDEDDSELETETNSANTMENMVTALDELKRAENSALGKKLIQTEIDSLVIQKLGSIGQGIDSMLHSREWDQPNMNTSVRSEHNRGEVANSYSEEWQARLHQPQQSGSSNIWNNHEKYVGPQKDDDSFDGYILQQRQSLQPISSIDYSEAIRRKEEELQREDYSTNRNLNQHLQEERFRQHPLTVAPALMSKYAGIGAGLYSNDDYITNSVVGDSWWQQPEERQDMSIGTSAQRSPPPPPPPLPIVNRSPSITHQQQNESNSERPAQHMHIEQAESLHHSSHDEIQYPDPSVEDLIQELNNDKFSLEGTSDLEQLQRSCKALLNAVMEEREHRVRLEARLAAAQEETLEIKTQSDIEIEGQKVEIIRLKGQIRQLCSENSLGDVLNSFEDNVSRLVKENEALRTRNIYLEARDLGLHDSVSKRESKDFAGTGFTRGAITASLDSSRPIADTDMDELPESSYLATVKDAKTVRLNTKIKKLMQENEELKRQNEEFLRQRRVQIVTTKLASDAKQKMKQYFTENQQLTAEVERLRSAVQSLEQDVVLITEDTKDIRQSEQQLREERAKTLSEISQLRDRVRELDNERKRFAQINRFIAKHSKFPADYNDTEIELGAGVAGLADAPYMRPEEQNTLSEGLESMLSAMHSAIIDFCPKMLPLYRNVVSQIHFERTKYLHERSRLLGLLYKKPHDSPSKEAKKRNGFNPQSEPTALEIPKQRRHAPSNVGTASNPPYPYQSQFHNRKNADYRLGPPLQKQVQFNNTNDGYGASNGGLGISFTYGPREAKVNSS